MKELGTILGIVVLVVLLVTIGPWLLLWSLNTLLGNDVEFTFWTWLAGLVFLALVGSTSKSS